MDTSSDDRIGFDFTDFLVIQDLVNYAERRFRKILRAMEKAIDIRKKWMEMCLQKEIVRICFFCSILSIFSYIVLKYSISF